MRSRCVIGLGLASALLLNSGCASFQREGEEDSDAGVSYDRGAVVISGMALADGPGTVLAAMTGKVPNFRVKQGYGECPDISLRNYTTFQTMHNPHVYVDGTRATDTCILETLRTNDVDRVEVYPQGYTIRPGYGTHAAGLILIFMRDGRAGTVPSQ